jgi:hypothetical protein
VKRPARRRHRVARHPAVARARARIDLGARPKCSMSRRLPP